VWRIVPPERYSDFVARETEVLAGVTVLVGGVAVGLVASPSGVRRASCH
jgi:hypothetical protein